MTTREEFIPLSIARNYVSSWGVLQAIRELIANAVDTGSHSIYFEGDDLHIESFGGSIPREHLLLGSGSKTKNTDTIGQFNEGMKLALLILEREGFKVEILNGEVCWTPFFQHSNTFNEECLHIMETDCVDGDEDFVSFIIKDVDQDLQEEITHKHLVFDDERDFHDTPQGEILLDDQYKGHIYCGGVWVTEDPTFEYGYNFNVDCLKLDRDRQTVKTFDIQWQTKEMWSSIAKDPDEEQVEHITKCIENNKNDTTFLYSSYPTVSPEVKDKLHDNFIEANGEDAVITGNYEESERLKESGYKNVVFSNNEVLVKTIKSSDKYKTINFKEKEDPMTIILDFYEEWSDNMDTDMYDAYQEMIEKLETLI